MIPPRAGEAAARACSGAGAVAGVSQAEATSGACFAKRLAGRAQIEMVAQRRAGVLGSE